jgi:hypothetical protein|tara:strand:+ start:283 stop:624 length:342 start_codon:yes stop_codon:yes gene_type:complete
MSSEGFVERCKLRELEELYSWVGDPVGTPTSTHSPESINERLEKLAFRELGGQVGPPMEAYTTTPGQFGDVVRATPEYVRWFRRTYPAARPEDRVSPPAPRSPAEGVGGALVF